MTASRVPSGQYTAPDGNTNQFKSNGAPVTQGIYAIRLKNLGPGTTYIGVQGGTAADMYPMDVGEALDLAITSPQVIFVRMTAASKLAWIGVAP